MAPKLWSFPVHVSDFLLSEHVAKMTTEQIGAYFLLLLHGWSTPDGSIPDDTKTLAGYARMTPIRWRKIETEILLCYESRNGRLYNSRLTEELDRISEFKKRQQERIAARWDVKKEPNEQTPAENISEAPAATSAPNLRGIEARQTASPEVRAAIETVLRKFECSSRPKASRMLWEEFAEGRLEKTVTAIENTADIAAITGITCKRIERIIDEGREFGYPTAEQWENEFEKARRSKTRANEPPIDPAVRDAF